MRPDLEDLVLRGANRSDGVGGGPVRLQACPRRVRAVIGDHVVADCSRVRYLFERDHLPVYPFPREDLDATLLVASEHTTECPRKGRARYWHVEVGDRRAENAVWAYEEPLAHAPQELAGLAALYWNAADHWYEEDEEVFVHARDPYSRVDVVASSRHVRIEIDGTTVADSTRPHLVFETSLPTRCYLPRHDVRLDLLRDSATRTACPYKGTASYYTAVVDGAEHADVAWYYDPPVPEQPKLAQLVCFYDEKVDVWVDGERRARPVSAWS